MQEPSDVGKISLISTCARMAMAQRITLLYEKKIVTLTYLSNMNM